MEKDKQITLRKNRIEPFSAKKILLVMLILTSISCVNLVSAAWGNLNDDLLGYWSFDVDAIDDSGNGHDGILQNAPVNELGKVGNCYSFKQEKKQVINVTHDGAWDFGSHEFSISFWINVSAPTVTEQGFITHSTSDGHSGFRMTTFTDKFYYAHDSPEHSQLFSPNVYVPEIWQHIVIVRNATNSSMWINGTLEVIGELATMEDTVYPLTFGARWFGPTTQYFNGSLDEIGIWNRSLSDSEIADLWNGGAGLAYGGGLLVRLNVTLTSPTNNFKSGTVGLNFTGNYTIINANLTNATYYIWDSDGIIFNDTETVLISGTTNSSTQEINNFTAETYTWNIFVCGENATQAICGWEENNYSFEYVPFSVIGESYSNQTIEGNLETFSISIKMEGGYTLSIASLVYNNTNYLGTLDDLGGGNYEISRSLIIPSVSLDTNVTFYWAFSFENEFLTNTTSHNQSVFNVIIDDCSTHTNVIYNFTIVDEESQDPISANNSIEILVNVYSIDRSILILNYSESFNMSSMGLCINRELGNFTSTHLLDSTIKYSAQDHETEYYNIANYNLTNQSKVQNVILYDLLTSDSTEFQLTFTGSNFLAVENALVFVKRQYVSENVFKTVELPKTDSNGQTILHLVKNDIIYNLEIMKDGIVIGHFKNIIAFCEDVVIGDCKITLSAAESGDEIFKYDDALGITYTGPTYNNATRLITFNFLTTDGSVKTILMEATRNDIFGNRSVCSAFVISSGGTLICAVPSYIDDSTIITKVFVDGVEILKDYTVLSEFSYGKDGYFIFFIYMIAFILMFSKSKTTMLIGIMVGFIVGISLGLISGRLVGIGASGIWLAIVVILMVWKLNKERPN